jgi:hypothetical protein
VVATNEWGVVVHHRSLGVLELRWRQDGAPMTDAGFMATLCLLASVAERLSPPGVLIDATHFAHRFGEGVMEWRSRTVIPRYGGAGVRKFGFILPHGSPHAGREVVEEGAVFPTAWFDSRDNAMGWLTGQRRD